MSYLPDLLRRDSFFGFANNPMRELTRLQRQMESFLGESYSQFSPTCEVEEAEDVYWIHFDIPGMKKEDIQIEMNGSVLTVSGERREERRTEKSSAAYPKIRSERFYGSFARSFTLPEGVRAEQIEARYQDGVLRIAVPKPQVSAAKKIEIADGHDQTAGSPDRKSA